MRCDAHVHVVGDPDRYPQIPTRTYQAGVARLEDLERHGAARGVSRFVLVQISVYGSDNTVLLENLDRLGDRGRGVVVVDAPATTRQMLAGYAARGVRGVRVNLYSSTSLLETGGRAEDAFTAAADLARAMNWHVEVIAPLGLLAEKADLFARAGTPVVVDHYGLHGRSTPDSAEGRRLLELLRLPHVWMKLSGPYRVTDDPVGTRPNPAWLAAIVSAAEDRCVWGSDWPHTPPHETERGPDVVMPYRDLRYAALVDDFLAALDSTERAERILVDNPARLYDFPGTNGRADIKSG